MPDVWAGVSAAPSDAAVLHPRRLKPPSAEIGRMEMYNGGRVVAFPIRWEITG